MEGVVLTRNPEKDRELARRLDAFGVPYASVPLLEHAPGPDFPDLAGALGEAWAWVAVTSPTAAGFLARAWEAAGRPALRVAALGGGTARALERAGLTPEFTAPEAYGRALAETLPEPGPLLWPTSSRAGEELGRVLEARGFRVRRLDAYTTRPRPLAPEEVARLEAAAVAAVASPSAVAAWVRAAAARPPLAAIGRVTAEAARAAGFVCVVWPERPGVAGWAERIRDLYEEKGHLP
ncbi:Uroporphyrinogen III synthase HEM4 [Oceanithermus profundus DSM 14977]|uniref:Uroporphyrinogen-III synthase n=1 Tax=Oceanithermus profundus (strain DSM 14977 / NBRC 100410 / VKM B-2274 / 506) TaxID=670487 RepID=E4U9E6_OCEP5|nr:uroporphyrinogen-III synthase [Oceanithermus profundus]ADR37042.1 Uroporphyrinogen III synthase HEM4 [Oceanithermus profundus DSM 14977]